MLAYTGPAVSADGQNTEGRNLLCLDHAAVTSVACEDGQREKLRSLNVDLAAAVETRDAFIAIAMQELRKQ